MTTLWSEHIETPVGTLTAVASADGLRALLWPHEPSDRVPLEADPEPGGDAPALKRTETQLADYFAGRRKRFELPLDPVGTAFQRDVWCGLVDIPHGTTTTYGELAAAIGRPGAARAVGAAVGRNPLSIVVPCHRVVGADGTLTGFAGGLDAKRDLLAHETAVAAHVHAAEHA